MSKNSFNCVQLNQIREQIESMTKFNQIEILRILTKNNKTTINENKYGIHINLSELDGEILNDLLVSEVTGPLALSWDDYLAIHAWACTLFMSRILFCWLFSVLL